MGYAEDMRDIVVEHSGRKVRYFVRADPDTRQQDLLYARDDLEWTEEDERAVDSELQELVAKPAYEATLDAENVTQLVKVADDIVVFTGFIEDEVVVVSFERGVLPALPGMVAEFREYMVDNDIDFTELDVPADAAANDD